MTQKRSSQSVVIVLQARQNFGVVELDGLIYVLGGENEAMELMTVEVFDPHFNSWKMQTSMTMIRKVNPPKRRTTNPSLAVKPLCTTVRFISDVACVE